jgi:hypothetical protein
MINPILHNQPSCLVDVSWHREKTTEKSGADSPRRHLHHPYPVLLSLPHALDVTGSKMSSSAQGLCPITVAFMLDVTIHAWRSSLASMLAQPSCWRKSELTCSKGSSCLAHYFFAGVWSTR